MNNINLNDFNNICRTCMSNCDIKFSQDNVISSIFYKLTEIHFETNVELPQQICFKCFEKINEIHEFAFQCRQTQSSLLKYLHKLKNPEMNVKQEFLEDIKEPLKTEEVTINEPSFQYFKDEILSSGSLLKLEKDKVLEEKIIPETIDQNISCSADTSDVKMQTEEEINNSVNLNDSNEGSSNSINSAEKSKKKHYKCDVCNKSFNDFTLLVKHKSVQTCERSYKCKHCLKMFSRSFSLEVHMRTHTGERPFKCKQCINSFSHLSHLKTHMRTHTGERPYQCSQCLLMFAHDSTLKRHIRTHTGERPYKCEQCSKMFTQSSSLKSHMRTHTSERPHKCNKCSKAYRRSYDLKQHMSMHSSECRY